MSNLTNWAMDQINRLEVPEEKKAQYKSVLDAFSKQGHSGTTASYALSYINLYIEKGYEEVKTRLDAMLGKGESEDEDGMQSLITKNILEVVDLFKKFELGKEEAHNLSRLMDWKPIIPLTGEDAEWGEVHNWNKGKNTQQNKLCSAVFRDNFDNSTAHYIYGRVYSDNGGHSWFTTGRGTLQSSIPVEFPFYVPDKSEHVYLNGEDSEEIITDEARIKELYDEWDKSFKEAVEADVSQSEESQPKIGCTFDE